MFSTYRQDVEALQEQQRQAEELKMAEEENRRLQLEKRKVEIEEEKKLIEELRQEQEEVEYCLVACSFFDNCKSTTENGHSLYNPSPPPPPVDIFKELKP